MDTEMQTLLEEYEANPEDRVPVTIIGPQVHKVCEEMYCLKGINLSFKITFYSNPHILHNLSQFSQFFTFCTIWHMLHSFSHVAQFCTFSINRILCSIFDMMHNFEQFAQFCTFLDIL